MKKLLFTVIAISSISFLSAQKVKFGAKASLSFSKLSVTDPQVKDLPEGKFLVGFNVGGFAEISITDQFAFQPELLYSAQGSKSERNSTTTDSFPGASFTSNTNVKSTLKTSYINIPLLAKFYATKELFFVAGPQIGFILNAKGSSSFTSLTTQNIGGVITNTSLNGELQEKDAKEYYNTIDFGVGLGAGYFFTENLFAEARYNIGLSNNYKQKDETFGGVVYKDERVEKASSIQVSVGYRF
jgi:Outer membrane protein beta-barrel domain